MQFHVLGIKRPPAEVYEALVFADLAGGVQLERDGLVPTSTEPQPSVFMVVFGPFCALMDADRNPLEWQPEWGYPHVYAAQGRLDMRGPISTLAEGR